MKRFILLLIIMSFLVSCTNKDRQTEEINTLNCVTSTERVILKYKTVDDDNNVIDSKDDQDVEIITEGKDGYKDIVYCNDDVLNEWVYESASHEVGRVKNESKEDDKEITHTSEVVDNGNGTTPPTNNGGSDYVPPTDNEEGGSTTPPTEPTKPTEVKPINPAQIGNSGMLFLTSEEAYSWANNEMMNNWLYWKNILGFEITGWSGVHVRMTDDTTRTSIDFY